MTAAADPEVPKPSGRGRAWLVALALCVVASAGIRIYAALSDEAFAEGDAEGVLRSDPALLYYLLERVVEAGGGVPADFGADPRIEHPGPIDVPAEFAVGQEFLLAWAHRLFGGDTPLHVFSVVAMGIVASLALLGAWGLALELTRSRRWACAAAVACALVPASYRTAGFVLMREDLSFPLFAVHLWLVARAARLGGARAFALAALPLGLALATWHASGFLLAIEVGALVLWTLVSGRSPFARRGAWALLPVLLAAALLVPVLRAKGAVLSAAFLGLYALAAAAAVDRRGPRATRTVLVAGLALGLAVTVLGPASTADHRHVLELLGAKLVYLGQLPPDPTALSFDARLLWQGPFATADPAWGSPGPWLALLLWLAAGHALWRGRRTAADDPGPWLLAALALLCAFSALLVQRLAILPAVAGPALAAVLVARLPRHRTAVAAIALTAQAAAFTGFVAGHEIPWHQSAERRAELRDLLAWIDDHVPPDQAVAADFVTSPAILAHARRPIVLQPKYEAGESRQRTRAFFDAFFHGGPGDLAALLSERFQCRFLVVDRYTLGVLSPYVAGLSPLRGIPAGSAAGRLLGENPTVPGYRLRYPGDGRTDALDGLRTTSYRVFELVD